VRSTFPGRGGAGGAGSAPGVRFAEGEIWVLHRSATGHVNPDRWPQDEGQPQQEYGGYQRAQDGSYIMPQQDFQQYQQQHSQFAQYQQQQQQQQPQVAPALRPILLCLISLRGRTVSS